MSSIRIAFTNITVSMVLKLFIKQAAPVKKFSNNTIKKELFIGITFGT
jgi:hypothetical protein